MLLTNSGAFIEGRWLVGFRIPNSTGYDGVLCRDKNFPDFLLRDFSRFSLARSLMYRVFFNSLFYILYSCIDRRNQQYISF
jgi:hypothetical protein